MQFSAGAAPPGDKTIPPELIRHVAWWAMCTCTPVAPPPRGRQRAALPLRGTMAVRVASASCAGALPVLTPLQPRR